MTEAQKLAINAPVAGLLIFQVTGNVGFYYYDGTKWTMLGAPGGQAWGINGNSGLTSGVHFFGTIDNAPVDIRINNLLKFKLTYQGQIAFYNNGNSIFIGENAGNVDDLSDNYNVFIGKDAGKNNTSGYQNLGTGFASLFSNTNGYYNTAYGYASLFNNTTGNTNTAMGSDALDANTSGSFNVALGNAAAYNNIKGNYNTALGFRAMLNVTNAGRNVAIGNGALNNLSFDNAGTVYYTHNIAVGNNALFNTNATSTSNGAYNTAIGSTAGDGNTTGSHNTYVGYNADGNSGSLTNATVIGSNAVVNASNKIRLGNTNVSVIEGQVAYSYPSDARFKYNVQNNIPGLAFITRLSPVTYQFNTKKFDEFIYQNANDSIRNEVLGTTNYKLSSEIIHSGLLAQEVEKICIELGYNFDGLHIPTNENDHYSIAYGQLIMPLIKSVQELKVKNDELSKQNEAMKAELDEIKAIMMEIKANK